MKKLLSFVLCLFIVPCALVLCACSDGNTENKTPDAFVESGKTFVYVDTQTKWNNDITDEEIDSILSNFGFSSANDYLQAQASLIHEFARTYKLEFGNNGELKIYSTSDSEPYSLYYERNNDTIKIYADQQKTEWVVPVGLYIDDEFKIVGNELHTNVSIDVVIADIKFEVQE